MIVINLTLEIGNNYKKIKPKNYGHNGLGLDSRDNV